MQKITSLLSLLLSQGLRHTMTIGINYTNNILRFDPACGVASFTGLSTCDIVKA